MSTSVLVKDKASEAHEENFDSNHSVDGMPTFSVLGVEVNPAFCGQKGQKLDRNIFSHFQLIP
jgi:hypothetical protein